MQFRLKDWIIPGVAGITGIISFAAGAGFGYFLFRQEDKRKEYVFAAKMAKRIEEIESNQLQFDFDKEEREREFKFHIQQADHVAGKMRNAATAATELIARIADPIIEEQRKNNGSETMVDIEHEEELVSIFRLEDDKNDDWDYVVEIAQREANPNKPYIIHDDEYSANEDDYRHSTLTFYAGDNILTDEFDVPVYNPDKVVGELRFGHGSRDPSICYVRNDHLMAEYEVIIDHGYYQTEVLGEQIEHSLKRAAPKPKFRME